MFFKYKKAVAVFFLSGLLISNFYFTSTPVAKALDGGAGWAHFFQYTLKEFGLDVIARGIASRLLKRYLDDMVKQINQSGRTGRQPSFVLNWRNFLTDAQYRGEDVFRSVLGNTILCGHTGNRIRTTFQANAPQPISQNTRVNNFDPFTRRARCTLPSGWTLDNFRRDFNGNGAWAALNKLAQPQNNFYGSFLMGLGEVAAQRSIDAAADRDEVGAGAGSTGTRASCRGGGGIACLNNRCVGGRLNGRSCVEDTECYQGNAEARCTFLGTTLTPGNLLTTAGANWWDKKAGWLLTSDELSEVIFNLLGGLIDKLVNFRSATGDDSDARDSETDRYNQCVRDNCRGQSGDAYRACLEDCAGNLINPPGDYNFTNPSGPPPPGPPPPVPSGPQVTLCDGPSFTGTCEIFTSPDPWLADADNYTKSAFIPNDSASSVRVPAGTTVYLCQDVFFGHVNSPFTTPGSICEPFSADDADLSNNPILDNTVSSIRWAPMPATPSCGDVIQIADPNAGSCSFNPGPPYFSAGPTYDCSPCYYNPQYAYTESSYYSESSYAFPL